jgi:16S rRNA (cytidine1402-2'-O)-methyltransferase
MNSPNAASGALYIVSTPIGNLEDITLRAIRILKEVDLIAAEDTRHTRKLMAHFDIHKPLRSYHSFNETQMTIRIIDELKRGWSVALVTDGGTPCISDPGFALIAAARREKITVTSIPGACAAITALSQSGMPFTRFLFEGFLPRAQRDRNERWEALCCEECAFVIYEAPHRLLKFLEEADRWIPERQIALSRELTKIHEETITGTAREILEIFKNRSIKGEITLVVSPGKPPSSTPPDDLTPLILEAKKSTASNRDAAQLVAQRTNLPFRKVYRRILELEEH